MHADWHQLRHDGLERHRAFLAEAARRDRLRRFRRRGQPNAPAAGQDGSGAQPGWADPTRRPVEAGAGRDVVFTEREWQYLVFLRWRYRQGHLAD